MHIRKRKNDYSAVKKCKSQPRIYHSLKKYGWGAHTFEIIEECSVENLSERERHWQDFYDVLGENGLNCLLTLTTDKSGNLHPETKKRMKAAKTGEKSNVKKTVVCTITGEEWYSAKNCAESNGININSLVCKLIGRTPNTTPYIYKKDLHLKDTRANQTPQNNFKGENNPMFGKSRGNAPSARPVVCSVTGKVWETIKMCGEENGIKPVTLGGWLRGTSPNKSTFKFLINE